MLRCTGRASKNFPSIRAGRWLCTSVPLGQKTLASLILQQKPQDPPKKRILILLPEETKDRTLSQYEENIGKTRRKLHVPQHIQKLVEDGIYETPTEEIDISMDKNIDLFKPAEQDITLYRAHYLVEALVTSFKKDHLLAYVRSHGMPMPRRNKHQIAEMIVGTIWRHKRRLMDKKGKRELMRSTSQILKEEYVSVTKFEIFMLLSQQGKLWKDVKSSLSSVKFSADKTKLRMVGSESQLQNARVLMSSRIDNCYREEVDLLSIRKLYEEKFGTFSVKTVGKFTEVYFTHLEGDKYELASLNPNQIKRIRRLFLWHLAYNLHLRKSLQKPENLEEISALPFSNDYTLSWKERGKLFFLLSRGNLGANSELKNELERFSEENLQRAELTGLDFSEVNEREMAKETYDLLESIGLLEDDLDIPKEQKTEEQESENLERYNDKKEEITISEAGRTEIYQKLTDFTYTSQLPGLPKSQLEVPVFTTTLGQLLFESKENDNIVSTTPKPISELVDSPYIFNTSIPLAYDHALTSTIRENSPANLDEDPHTYSLQMKFMPSPFVEEFGDEKLKRSLADQIKYPPVEMWVQLNSQSVPDLETLQVVTVEAENSHFVSFPSAKSDLRVTCQITGRVLEGEESEESESGNVKDREVIDDKVDESDHENSTNPKKIPISELLESTTSKYSRFSSQPGIIDFLEKSELDFSGRKPTSIAPWIELDIAGAKVRYDYVNTSYRRELTLDSKDVSVQLSIVDGGSLDGRRPEVRFVGDFNDKRETFDKLLDYTLAYVNDL